jgi:AraC-like DNA-binding protein
VPAALDRHAYAELSTASVPGRDAFAFWREAICATFVRLGADPVGLDDFEGRIEHVPVGDLALSTVDADSQHVRRTRSLIAGSNEEYLLASIQIRGTGRVEQDGRTAVLEPGEMAFYDSTRPYTLHFDERFSQLVVQLPKRELALAETRSLTARRLGSRDPGGVVSTFFISLAGTARQAPEAAAVLLPHAIGLLSAAASFAGQARSSDAARDALARERVVAFLRGHLHDSQLDAETVARACGMSRRTLYRLMGEGGLAARLRRLRIERAKSMLLSDPSRPVGAVAAACGFDSESGFHRAFRTATGRTPRGYPRRDGTAGH